MGSENNNNTPVVEELNTQDVNGETQDTVIPEQVEPVINDEFISLVQELTTPVSTQETTSMKGLTESDLSNESDTKTIDLFEEDSEEASADSYVPLDADSDFSSLALDDVSSSVIDATLIENTIETSDTETPDKSTQTYASSDVTVGTIVNESSNAGGQGISNDLVNTINQTGQETDSTSENNATTSSSASSDATPEVPVEPSISMGTTSGNPELSADYLAVDIPLAITGYDLNDLSIIIDGIPVNGMVFSNEDAYLRAGAGKASDVDVSDWDVSHLKILAPNLVFGDHDITITISNSEGVIEEMHLELPQFEDANYVKARDFDGDADQDFIVGGRGANNLDGGDGNDFIYGQSGSDTIVGGDGNDVIVSGDGREVVHAGDGDDIVYGGANVETLYGDAGNDQLYAQGGGKGHELYGGEGDDILGAASGRGTLLDGGKGEDTASFVEKTSGLTVDLEAGVTNQGDILTDIENILGSQYDDTLKGNAYDNILTGGDGADRFVATTGQDVITDFESGADVIDFSDLGLTSEDALTMKQVGANIVITNADMNLDMTLENMALSDLTEDDLIF